MKLLVLVLLVTVPKGGKLYVPAERTDAEPPRGRDGKPAARAGEAASAGR